MGNNGYFIWKHFHIRGILGLDVYVMWPDMFSYLSSSSWVWNGLPHPETTNIHHKYYGNIISDPSRWTIPNYTEEKPSPSTKISMICVDTNGYLIWKHFHLRGILGLDVYVMWPDRFFPMFSSSSWVWNGLPDPETTNIHHKYYGNIISDPSRWTIPNYTEEKPSPSTKISMICVDTNGYLIWKHFHLRGILGLDVYVMWPDMFFLCFPHLHGSEMVYQILKP